MLKIVLLAYSQGLISSRSIEQACARNVQFIAISGDSQPSHTHIAKFVCSLSELKLKSKEQNAFLQHWEVKWAASRIHGSERRQVQAMFEEERAHLQPLPILGMQYFTESQRTVCDDSCVRVDHSSYAARPAPIGSKVLV